LTYNLIDRIAELHKKDKNISCAAVVRYLRTEKHIKVNTSEFSLFARGVEDPPKSELVLSEADKIVTRWEHER
jgi:hypothetical protein